MKNQPLKISNITVQPGERITLALPTPEIYTCAPVYIPIHVIHGKRAGPTLLVCGSIHGDEINGIGIIQRLLKMRLLGSIRGTLIIIPTLNIYGMMTLSRNLPDRRDLEGSFPGSETGSFASRLAYFLNEEIFAHITHCIDIHTGEPHISKFPQVKTIMNRPELKDLANAFQAPVVLNTESQKGLLWLNEREHPVPTILYETGEALRLDHQGIKVGVQGIVRVMRHIDMLSKPLKGMKSRSPLQIRKASWIHASSSGLCEFLVKSGTFVASGSRLAAISDPFGTEQKEEIFAPYDGIVIARNNLPILHEGEPILQLAGVNEEAAESIQDWSEEQGSDLRLE